MLDLDYSEDRRPMWTPSRHEPDGRWIEVQTTAEGAPFHPELFMTMSRLAREGIRQSFALWDS